MKTSHALAALAAPGACARQGRAVDLRAGADHALNSLVTPVAEVGQTRSKAFDGATARMNGGAGGGIIFF